MQHRHFATRFFQHLERAGAFGGVVFQMQQEIEQSELKLADEEQAGMEVTGRQHALEQFVGQGVRRSPNAWRTGPTPSRFQPKFSMNWLGSSTASHSTPSIPPTEGSGTSVSR